MRLFVITPAETGANEHEIAVALFKAGLRVLHIRKPGYSSAQLSAYLNKFPHDLRPRLTLHSHHSLALRYGLGGVHLTERHRKQRGLVFSRLYLYRALRPRLRVSASFHRLGALRGCRLPYSYLFFSPVFPGITKEQHHPNYSQRKIGDVIPHVRRKVVALGGIVTEKLPVCSEMGFSGAALVGSIWTANDPLAVFQEAYELCKTFDREP